MSFQRLYNEQQNDYSSEYSSSDESNIEEEENNLLNYENKDYSLIINTEDRDWTNLFKNTFSFQVKFDASESSNETRNIFTNLINNVDNVNRYNRTIKIEKFSGSRSLSIPVKIKNINSITIDRVILPTREIYLGNGNFINLINIKNLNIVIDEFSNVNYGTNDISNSIFSSLIIFTPVYPETGNTIIPNFVEFKNVRLIDKEFKPAPLNGINSLTFNFYDNLGNKLKYLRDILTIKSIDFLESDNKFIKIITNEYFYRKNYKENDIIIIKNVSNYNNFLERKEGHKIYFNTTYNSEVDQNSNLVPSLQNEFYIIKNGSFNDNTGNYDIIETTNGNIESFRGSIINKNLQISIYMTINSKFKSFLIL